MFVPNACPECQEGDLVVEYGIARCDSCLFMADVNAVRRVLTVRTLEARRKSRQAVSAA